jgi:hypothetical protein
MSKCITFCLVLSLAVLAGILVLTQLVAQAPPSTKEPVAPQAKAESPAAKTEVPATPVKPKPLSPSVKKGLAYLVNQQHDDGGWGQGGGWRQGDQGGGRIEGPKVADPSDLGDTCIAVLSLMRAGHTPKDGEYAQNVARAVDFILGRIEKADQESLYLTDVRNTQLQVKIGPYVDTFLAQLVMAELKGQMPEARGEKRLLAAFDKTMTKIAKHQKADGNFAQNEAWASTLSMALCSKGINRAAQNGFMVPQTVLAADLKVNTAGLDRARGTFTAPVIGAGGMPASSDAGVAVYRQSGQTAGLQEAVNTLKKDEKKNQEIVKSSTAAPKEKEQAKRELERLGEAESAQKAAVDGLIRRLDDKQFIQGFGSNGGEEFLSYMNISETLVVKGGKDWVAWDKGISDALTHAQDKDGGWSGQHCITGRTFCTATALLTLLADRAPIPVVKKDDKKDEKK